MIVTFGDQGTQDIFNGEDTKAARKLLHPDLWGRAKKKLDQINYATSLGDLRLPPSNELHPLTGNLKGKHAIKINKQFRIIFSLQNGEAKDVQITDYH